MSVTQYDLVVIGSGPAGHKGAIGAAKMRKKVAIIDRKQMIGGVCVNSGTVPSNSRGARVFRNVLYSRKKMISRLIGTTISSRV